jgi:hypothetical protein
VSERRGQQGKRRREIKKVYVFNKALKSTCPRHHTPQPCRCKVVDLGVGGNEGVPRSRAVEAVELPFEAVGAV